MGVTRSWVEVAEAALTWVLGHVRSNGDGPRLVPAASVSGEAGSVSDAQRDSVYEGVGGVGLVLAELQLSRPWRDHEAALARAIVRRLTDASLDRREASLYLGLAGDVTAVRLLAPGRELALLRRLAELATADGWPTTLEGLNGPISDLLLGTAGIVLAGLWAGGELGERIATIGCDALARQARTETAGVSWRMHDDVPELMPNYSHGNAGIAAALAMAGAQLDRTDWIDVAVAGAEYLVAVANHDDGCLRVPHYVPHVGDEDEFTYSWCHGPTGTSYLFLALHAADVDQIAGRSPLAWHTRALHALRTSGVPARRYPGFWDNDGRCCGTAGAGDVFLDDAALHATSDRAANSLAFAQELADTLVERAIIDDKGARWQFIEHRNDPPLLPPGTGWMQGASGIAAFLLRVARVSHHGPGAPRLSTPSTLPLERALNPRH